MRLAGDAGLIGTFFERLFSQIHTSRSGFLKGNGRSSTALTTLKMAVFAPMPSASVSTATALKPGFFSNWRMANFESFMVRGQLSVVRGPWSLVGRRPNSQSPNPKRQRNPKPQIPKDAAGSPPWSFELGASLVFGVWCFHPGVWSLVFGVFFFVIRHSRVTA